MVNRSCLLIAAAAAGAIAIAGPAPASAAPVIAVDGERASRVEDPFVPPRAEIDLGPATAPSAGPRAQLSARGGRAVSDALKRAQQSGSASASTLAGYRRTLTGARAALRRLRGARRTELRYVIASLERIAIARRLTASRMPSLFLQLRRNASYWRSKPFPGSGDQITFRGSELLFQYFPGRGLQLHPLSNFKKANLLHGACTRSGRGRPVCGARPPGPRRGTPCRPARLRRLLDELSKLAVRRGRGFIAWEYLFDFGGGSPPWMSAMAQSTAIVALGRAARLLDRPEYNRVAGAALGAFEARRPTGVRTRGPLGGTHYLQYSFAPRLYVFNAFLQSLIGLYDYARLARDDRAKALYEQAEPEARGEVPHSDLGDWSRYSFRGAQSTGEYHELLREMLQGMGRRVGGIYCEYAIRYRGYQKDPPRLRFRGPKLVVPRKATRVVFSLSKLSVVELRIFKGERLVFRRLATLRRGRHSFSWRPRSRGDYAVRLGAKELRTGRSLRGRTAATVTVAGG